MSRGWHCLRSIAVFLLFLELFFRAGEMVTAFAQTFQNRVQSQGAYRIMCIGESATVVGGDQSYPAQLERLLNAYDTSRKYEVINQGLAGTNTTTILEYLPQWLDMYQPDMVVAMIGIIDSVGEERRKHPVSEWLQELRLFRLCVQLYDKAVVSLRQTAGRFVRKPELSSSIVEEVSEQETFAGRFASQSEDLKKVYYLLQMARGAGKNEIANALYQQFLAQNNDPEIRRWVLKQYADFLVKNGAFGIFVSIMAEVPYDAWSFDWVKGYCVNEGNAHQVAGIIEGMVKKKGIDPLVYGYAAACYEQAGIKAAAEEYFGRMPDHSSYSSSRTIKNYKAIKDLLLARSIKPVFVQYPLRDVQKLVNVFSGDMDKGKITFVDNGPSFKAAVARDSYTVYFADRANGDTGHGTVAGNSLLAENVAAAILKPGK